MAPIAEWGPGTRDKAQSRPLTATLDQPEHGLTKEVLDQTDVLTWWGPCRPR